MVGVAINSDVLSVFKLKTELCCHNNMLALATQGLAQQRLVLKRAVDFRCIKKIAAKKSPDEWWQ